MEKKESNISRKATILGKMSIVLLGFSTVMFFVLGILSLTNNSDNVIQLLNTSRLKFIAGDYVGIYLIVMALTFLLDIYLDYFSNKKVKIKEYNVKIFSVI